jgi:hypothetical protein
MFSPPKDEIFNYQISLTQRSKTFNYPLFMLLHIPRQLLDWKLLDKALWLSENFKNGTCSVWQCTLREKSHSNALQDGWKRVPGIKGGIGPQKHLLIVLSVPAVNVQDFHWKKALASEVPRSKAAGHLIL